jgi:Bacterial Ig-like domain/Immunoglobulin I-set domain
MWDLPKAGAKLNANQLEHPVERSNQSSQNLMKAIKFTKWAILSPVLCMFVGTAMAGTFKHITIDGSFGDWAGVPVAYSQAQDTTEAVAYKDISIANDENYLYIRFSIYGSDNPFTYLENMFFDADANSASGFNAGGYVGSEMLIQSGVGYQEKNGAFNEGGINGLDWLASPNGVGSEFEVRISRNATYASDGTPVFTNNTIAVELESDNSSFVNIEWFPPSAGGVVYTFENPPPVLTTNLPLIGLSSKSWQVNDSGTDLGVSWLDQAYDDSVPPWTSGLGLFGYTPQPGAYPAIQKALATGANTYYFRTHFTWSYETANIAFVVTNYLSDGAVYYLNGAEARRLRMPAGSVAYATSASGTNSPVGHADILGFPGGSLVLGDNILEVETHQAPSSGSDMVFGLSLTAATSYPVTIVDTNLPADQTVIGGQPVTFTADVLGSGPLSYQWLKNGSAIMDATNASFTIPLVLTNDIGNYSLRVANSFATNTTRQAHLTVNSTPVVIDDVSQPADQVVVEGRPVAFNAVASGSALLQYQWFHGVTAIPGETNATYSIAFTDPTNAGSYHVMISNPASSTNSRTAALTVLLDTLPPFVTAVAASAGQVVLNFSEPLDSTTANNSGLYGIIGGPTVTSAVLNPSDATQVTLTTSSSLVLGTVYSLTINGVKDLFGNAASATVSFARSITIDGNFDDWQGVAPIYSGPSGSDGAADFQNIYMSNDANNYYFRVTLYHDIPPASGEFPAYVNMFFNTDNDSNTGYSAVGSELLIQSGFAYQEKNGGFNEGSINGLNWMSSPAAPGSDFEFSFSRSATFASDSTPVFTTNVITFLFQGMTPSFAVLNQAPYDGSVLSYTNMASATVPSLPLGRIGVNKLSGGNVALVWDPPGTLQYRDSLAGSTWTNMPAATSPYVIPSSGGQRFFRLVH